MRLGPEGLLVLLIVALFLKDCVLMLHTDEAVLVRAMGGRWRPGFGARSWRLSGREPYLANPVLPHEPVVRLRWHLEPTGVGGAATRSVSVPREIVGMAPWVWLTWLILFLLLPATLLSSVPHVTVLTAVALLYLSIVLSLLVVWRGRQAMQLQPRAFSLLAFECLVCPPYAANMVRKLTTQLALNEEFAQAADRLLKPPALETAFHEIRARIDEQIENEGPESAAGKALGRGRLRFIARNADELE